MSAVVSLERFLNIRAAGGATFSPDGRFVAFLTNTTGVPQLWQVPVEGGWPTLLTFGAEAVRGASYSPTRHELIFSMDTGGNERTQLYRLAGTAGSSEHGLGDGWAATDISKQPKAIHQFGGWSHDGASIAFSANRAKDNRFDVHVQKPGEEPRLLKEGPGGYYSAAGWSPDDRHILVSRAESNFNQDLYVLDAATGKERHLTPHQGEVQFHTPRWFTSDVIYCSSTHGGLDRATLTTIDLKDGGIEVNVSEKSPHELETIEVSRTGKWIALINNADGRSKLMLRAGRGTPHAAGPDTSLDMPLGVISGLEFSPDETKLAFTFDGPRHNGDVWLWDLEKNKIRQLTFSSRAGIPFSTFVEPELVKYKSFDGLEIPAWFYPPQAPRQPSGGLAPSPPTAVGGLPPIIVYPHGGPESQTRPNFSGLFQYFVSRGYGIFAPNVRGSTGYGTRFMNLDNTVKRMDSVKDMAHGVMWLRDSRKADPKKIAVYGGSYGGFMVLAGVTNYPDLFAAGVDVVGICNFATFLENTGAYRRANREAEYGNLREHADFLKQISPIHHVDKIKCPMMVIHGANDPRVPVGEAEQIVAALKMRGVPVEYLRYEDEGHGLVKLKNRLDAYPKMVGFLDKYLK